MQRGFFCVTHARVDMGGYGDVCLVLLAKVVSVAAMDVVDLTTAVRRHKGQTSCLHLIDFLYFYVEPVLPRGQGSVCFLSVGRNA